MAKMVLEIVVMKGWRGEGKNEGKENVSEASPWRVDCAVSRSGKARL